METNLIFTIQQECHLNLKILLKVEMEFDEDFKVSANLYGECVGHSLPSNNNIIRLCYHLSARVVPG